MLGNVFVSYGRADLDWVGKLVDRLEAAGFAVWWDQKLASGQTYASVIEEVLFSADAIVVVWSPASLESRWVRDEVDVGVAREILTPVLKGVPAGPIGFRQYQTADLSAWPAPEGEQAFRQFVAALEARCRQSRQRTQEERMRGDVNQTVSGGVSSDTLIRLYHRGDRAAAEPVQTQQAPPTQQSNAPAEAPVERRRPPWVLIVLLVLVLCGVSAAAGAFFFG